MGRVQVSPNSANYMRAGTKIYVQRAGDSAPIAVGNIISAPSTVDLKTIEHVTGQDGLRVIDARLSNVSSLTYTVKTDEFTLENLKNLLLGDTISSNTQQTAGTSSRTGLLIFGVAASALQIGRWYDFTDLSGNKLYFLDRNNPVTIAGKVEGVDFRVDYMAGKFCALKLLVDGTNIVYNWVTGQKQRFNKLATAQVPVSGEGLFIFENGQVIDRWDFPKAVLEPSGNFDASDIEKVAEMEFKLILLYDPIEQFGFYERFQTGS